MKLITALVAFLATAAPLLQGVSAYSADYNELGARSSTLEVPFEHSLRSFLESAVDVHSRALDALEYENELAARTGKAIDIRDAASDRLICTVTCEKHYTIGKVKSMVRSHNGVPETDMVLKPARFQDSLSLGDTFMLGDVKFDKTNPGTLYFTTARQAIRAGAGSRGASRSPPPKKGAGPASSGAKAGGRT
ncbi:hypothetical protein DFP72DRAFT_911433 [Ephemerocybe angulata]|uniref:Uncharacterized protein n=1 Tax=Ephemerocybe angulata TaxID=980116 RepID=A0A8H6HP83_9AGAR|nr:hypothetical protein DFP72DRAFT_911433 [Tulosesus angulatus]